MKKHIKILLAMTLCGAIYKFAFEFGIKYAINNQYIEAVECQHEEKQCNFDYNIYLDGKMVANY